MNKKMGISLNIIRNQSASEKYLLHMKMLILRTIFSPDSCIPIRDNRTAPLFIFIFFFASASVLVFACLFSVVLGCLYLFFPCHPSNPPFFSKKIHPIKLFYNIFAYDALAINRHRFNVQRFLKCAWHLRRPCLGSPVPGGKPWSGSGAALFPFGHSLPP